MLCCTRVGKCETQQPQNDRLSAHETRLMVKENLPKYTADDLFRAAPPDSPVSSRSEAVVGGRTLISLFKGLCIIDNDLPLCLPRAAAAKTR